MSDKVIAVLVLERDDLAAMAMQGLCSALGREDDGGPTFDARMIARSAYAIADEMLAKRTGGGTK
jgi:hypothetical protein